MKRSLLLAACVVFTGLLSVSAASRLDLSSHIKSIRVYGGLKPSESFSARHLPVRVVITSQESWGALSLLLKEPLDVSSHPFLNLHVKGLSGGERLQVHLQDAAWPHAQVIQANSDIVPQQGLNGSWQTVLVDLRQVQGTIDLKQLTRLTLELGTETTENSPGMGLELADISLIGSGPLPLPRPSVAAKPKPKIRQKPSPKILPEPDLIPESNLQSRWSLPAQSFPAKFSVKKLGYLGFGLVFLASCYAFFSALWAKRAKPMASKLSENLTTPKAETIQEFTKRLSKILAPLPKPELPAIRRPMSLIYEINTRAWGAKRDQEGRILIRKFREIPTLELKQIKDQGFDTIWMMGVWEISPQARAISKRYGQDHEGSPYAIPAYRINTELGGEQEFIEFCQRIHRLGLKILVDFVPNHTSLDSEFLKNNPEYFIHRTPSWEEESLSDEDLAKRYPDYFVHHSERYPENGQRVKKRILVAYGRDPYSIPWIDTAQLDLTHPRLRQDMTEIIKRWAPHIDGVRCDMAMLVLRDQIKQMWHPHMPWEYFNRLVPEECWAEIIREVKKTKPDFMFLAESYWAKEGYLQQLGFDFTYDKALYDILREIVHSGSPQNLISYLQCLEPGFLARGCHFLENHDEERAMNAFGVAGQKAAAVMIGTIPGVPLFHQGQFEGKSERLPVQRLIPHHQEHPNQDLAHFYNKLIPLISTPVFRHGTMQYLNGTNPHLMAFRRALGREEAIVIVNLTGANQSTTVQLPQDQCRWEPEESYWLEDLYFPMKENVVRAKATVKSAYRYTAEHLQTQGLYVELGPFDSHIFRVKKAEAGVVSKFKSFLALS